jgi:hypothetical protein
MRLGEAKGSACEQVAAKEIFLTGNLDGLPMTDLSLDG